jgi:signal transduction histidine kinase/ActR/RegA family two-component response regulator
MMGDVSEREDSNPEVEAPRSPSRTTVESAPVVPPRPKAITEDLRELERRASLVMIMGDGIGRRYDVREEVVIGRSPDSSIYLKGPDVSRAHARIRRVGERKFQIQDLESRNGTLVNGLPVKTRELAFGDKIQIGNRSILLFTRYNQLEEQLLQAQKMESIGRLAGGVAHDFNNLLGAVMNNVGYLETLGPGRSCADPDVRECLTEIKTAITRAADLTRQLLGFARRGKYEDRPIEISRLVIDVAALVRHTFDRAIEVETETASGLTIQGDLSQLHQVLMNLCLNARDAMPGGGRLVLSATDMVVSQVHAGPLSFLSPGRYVVLTVRDTGHGMDEETCSRAFDPFFTTKPPGKGSGMGLATVYGIVNNHGGHIQAVSRPREGTTFHIYLPAVEIGSEVLETSPAEEAIGSKPLALVVDDEEVVRRSTRRLLHLLGYHALEARDGREALELFRKHHERIRFVLLDLIMPVMAGPEAFREMTEIDPEIRVLIASGYTDEDQVTELLADGAIGFLPKPFDRTTLETAIKKALEEADS